MQADPFGLLLVDKPSGMSSHDVVQVVRQNASIQKVGHTGTLDPIASGLLVLCLGAATRLSEYLIKKDKRYLARLRFGTATDTHDAEGAITQESLPIPTVDQVRAALSDFHGQIEQVPPAHSAIRVQGKRAYELARSGEKVELPPRPVTIHELQLSEYNPPDLTLEIHCSSGTYIRALARDLATSLATGAHLISLRRTQVGSFHIDQAQPLADLQASFDGDGWRSAVVGAAEALPELPAVRLGMEQLDDVRHGRRLRDPSAASGLARGLSQDGDLVAILEGDDEGSQWQPRKVFIS